MLAHSSQLQVHSPSRRFVRRWYRRSPIRPAIAREVKTSRPIRITSTIRAMAFIAGEWPVEGFSFRFLFGFFLVFKKWWVMER